MENKQAIEVLNTLIIINNDRIEGYKTAFDETDEQDLKSLFTDFISTSEQCKQELVREVTALGGEEAEGTKTSGKFFRMWMDVKASLTGKDRKAILNSCEYGEDQALETYDDALENEMEYLNTRQLAMISAQQLMLEVDHNKVKALRDALVAA